MGTEETIARTAVTESAGEAPPESSGPAASPPAAAVDTGASPSESSEAAPETSVESSQEASSFPTAENFGWSDWDGKIDGLPEKAQPWAQQIYDHRQTWVDKEMESQGVETQRLQDIYTELISGQADPRVAEGVTALEKLQTKFDELERTSGLTTTEYEEYKAAMQKAVNDEAEAIATVFKSAHPEIFDDKAKLALFGELLEEDWDLEAIPKVMALGEAAQAVARQARVAGTPDKFALQLAGSTISKPAAPRPGATITAGAAGSAPPPHLAKAGSGDARTFDEIRNNAALRALKAVRGGKR